MSDHTPDFHEVRGAYISGLPAMFTEKRVAEFDRFIADVKADARNETIDFISRHYEDYLPAEWGWKVEKEMRGKHE